MIFTLVMASSIAVSIHLARTRSGQVVALWREAKWYERMALLLLVVPIPGPVDELVAALAIRRIVKRRRSV